MEIFLSLVGFPLFYFAGDWFGEQGFVSIEERSYSCGLLSLAGLNCDK